MTRNVLAVRAEATVAARREPCDYCEQPIIWAVTDQDKRMPVDADPTDKGNVMVTDCAGGLRAVVLGTPAKRATYRAAGWPLRTHHKLSCPYADDWSRPGGPKRGRQNRPPAVTRRGAGQPARGPR